MNRFTKWLERRSDVGTPSPDILQLFSSGPTDSGQTVTPQTALSVPSVFSCIQVLSQDVARCPLRLRQETAPDTFEDATDHPLFELLASLPNPEQTAFSFKAYLQWQLLTHGRCYAEIVRVDGRVEALWPLCSEYMRVDRTAAGVKRWTYTGGPSGKTLTWLFDPSAPPIFEMVSETPLTRCREIVGSALGVQQYLARFFANGAKPSGILTAVGQIKDETAERLRSQWATNYGGSMNRAKVPLLDGGVTFTPISASNDDSQMNETLRTINEQVAGCFRIPPWKIGDTSKTSYSNMEAGELSYIVDSLDPWFALWEESLRRDVLTTRQYGQFTIQFDRQALIRNDVRSLNASLQSGIQNGYLSANEARRAIGLNPIPGGDVYRVNQALAPTAGKEPNVV